MTVPEGDEMSELIYNGEDDYINELGLERLLELSEKLPAEFDLGSTQAHEKSVTVTIKFPDAGPLAQLDHLHNVLTASQFVGTLARNLAHARKSARELPADFPTDADVVALARWLMKTPGVRCKLNTNACRAALQAVAESRKIG